MTVISVTLIRGTHCDFKLDDVEALKVLNLSNQGIDCIDNLEVFSHIEELHLAHNVIERIENVDFLNSLNLLDLSNNLINSESLTSSIGLLPRNIKTLILTGNPCSADKAALDILQRSYAGLNVIVNKSPSAPHNADEVSDESVEESDKKQTDEADQSEADHKFDETDDSDFPLNADEVLQSLVERKCRLQSIETFNVTKITEVLNLEYDLAVQIDIEKQEKKEHRSTSEEVDTKPSPLFMRRVEELMVNAAADSRAMQDFKSRLANTVEAAKAAMKAERPEITSRSSIASTAIDNITQNIPKNIAKKNSEECC